MRMVGVIEEEGQARRFVDYLLTIDIPSETRQASQGWSVWIVREDDVNRGQSELEAFRTNPGNPKYVSAAGTALSRRREAQRAERAHQRNTMPLGDRLNRITAARCPVTYSLIAICLLFALFSNVGLNRDALKPFYFSPPVTIVTNKGEVILRSARLDPIKRGELWRLWTSSFIHYGIVHLIFNMGALYRFGGLIELRKNWIALLGLAFVAAPVSSTAEYLWDLQALPPNAVTLPGGMSGVVYALFGYIWMKSDYEPESHLRISNNTVMFMLLWLLACMTGWMGPIANAAHLAGLIFGMCVGLAPYFFENRGRG